MADPADIAILPATAERFDDLAVLLAPKKDPDGPTCWCLSMRCSSAERRELAKTPGGLRERMRELTGEQPAPGVLAYQNGDVVGWCSVSPWSAYHRLVRSRTIPPPEGPGTWSIVCFVVRPGHRGQGITRHLLRGAVEYARSCGASAVEGYPARSTGERLDTVMNYVGQSDWFADAGFAEVAVTGSVTMGRPRVVMRREFR